MAKVLIVEDDPLMSRMYQKIFTFEKYEVELAGNGEEGLAKAASFKPTIILLDVMMPVMNGMQVLEKLKANEQTKRIPVVMLTNLAGQSDAEQALAHGAVKYIIKSEHDPKEVSVMVKEIIAGYTRSDIPQAAPTGPTSAAPAVDSAAPTPTTAPVNDTWSSTATSPPTAATESPTSTPPINT
jgi:two-component system, OmpR family, phosphate regulon response regulator PhoB